MAYKNVTRESTISAISDAFSEIQFLADEMTEWAGNMEEKLSHTEKYQAVSDAADELGNHVDEPEIPEWLGELKINYTEQVNKRKGAGCSRAVRLFNAQAILQAARDAADNWEIEEGEEEIEEEKGKKEEAEQLVSDLEEHCDFDVEFPGMYG